MTFHWPRPEVFESAGMRTLGYHDVLILPFEAAPAEAGKPINLSATVDLGLCDDICVPAHVAVDSRAEAAQPPVPSRAEVLEASRSDLPPAGTDPEITRALARVPDMGGAQPACTVEEIADGLRLTARLHHAPLAGSETAAMEVEGGAIWVSEPELSRDGDLLTARADLVAETGAPFELDPSRLRLTLIGTEAAVEFRGCEG